MIAQNNSNCLRFLLISKNVRFNETLLLKKGLIQAQFKRECYTKGEYVIGKKDEVLCILSGFCV